MKWIPIEDTSQLISGGEYWVCDVDGNVYADDYYIDAMYLWKDGGLVREPGFGNVWPKPLDHFTHYMPYFTPDPPKKSI